MLTGVGYQAGCLDQALQGVALGSVGEWLVTPNAAPLFAGSAPAEYLTKLGQPGYVRLLRQVCTGESPSRERAFGLRPVTAPPPTNQIPGG